MEAFWQFFTPDNPYFGHVLALSGCAILILILRGFKGFLLHQSQQNLLGASLYASYVPGKFFIGLVFIWSASVW